MTNNLNCSQGGHGGFSFYKTSSKAISTKLINLDNNCNLSDLNNIAASGHVSCVSATATDSVSCASLTSTGTVSCASVTTTGNITPAGFIYMSNASPIYLKSTDDINHYIKYDAVYDGPQIGIFTGTLIK